MPYRSRTATALLSGVLAAAVTAAAAPATFAGPALLLDVRSGKVLYAEDQDQPWHPASLTKIMTAYLTFEALRDGKLTLETKLVASEAAFNAPPSKIGLPVGGEITVELALKALVIKSANDIAIMLAEAIGGSEAEFIALMNATAKRVGMTRTNFVNPNGLPAPEQVTTARDLARLVQAVLADFPEHDDIWSMPSFKVGRRNIRSHNVLLRQYEGADGLKTGFICDSGYNVVATATRGGRRLMAIVLGETTGRDRAARAASLLEHGFQTYEWKSHFGATTLDRLDVAAASANAPSIRDHILSWDCGGRKARALARAKQRAQQIAKAREKANAQKATATAKPPAVQPGAASTDAKPKGGAATTPPAAAPGQAAPQQRQAGIRPADPKPQ